MIWWSREEGRIAHSVRVLGVSSQVGFHANLTGIFLHGKVDSGLVISNGPIGHFTERSLLYKIQIVA